MSSPSIKRIIGLSACCLLTTLWACDSFTFTFSFVTPKTAEAAATETVAIPGGARLVVNNEIGSTRVTVDPGATQLTVEITRIALAEDQAEADDLLTKIIVTITEAADQITIDAPKPAEATGVDTDFSFELVDDELNITGIVNSRRVAVVNLRITIPPAHQVEVTNYNGAIRAVDLDAASVLTSHNGRIHTIDATAALSLETYNGGIEVEGQRGSLDAETHNGGLEIEVRTLAAGQHVIGRTHNGRVELNLPSDIDAELSAETDNGPIEFENGDWDNVSNVSWTSWHELAATLNDGGPSIDVSTNNGRVEIDSY
ncbi:MAG: DUF4097 family beta strand repeat-containing protein [Planctomycetota bacterium]